MSYAQGVNETLYIKPEGAGGALNPATPWAPLRLISNSLTQSVEELESDELLPGRHQAESRSGTSSVSGDLEGELTFGTFDALIEAAFHGTWTSKTLADVTLSAAALDSSFSDSGNGFVDAGFVVGDIIAVSGFATTANNGRFKIASVAAGTITVTAADGSPVALVDEAAGQAVTIETDAVLKTGSTRRKFAILKHNEDIGRWLIYRGCEVNTVALDCPLQGKIGITFSVIGTKEEAYTFDPLTETLGQPTTTVMMSTFEGDLFEGGTGLNHATALNLSLENGMEAIYRLFSRDAYDIKLGRINVSGSLSAYIEDNRLKDKYLGETKTPISITLTDGENAYRLDMSRAKLTTASEEGSGDDALTQSYDFRAFNDPAIGSEITITRIAA
ncbi:MAG TPA: phage tail tube protein [Pseudomonas sp.]|nr:phage tail tube protein [Pseudomonas sp.]